jgi:drug/metabolite transporter (DMT)-like permease
VVGCGIAFAGAIVIGIATRGQSTDAGWGALLCLGAAAAYAVAVVVQKPLLERSSGLMITFLACAVAGVACLPFTPGLVHDLHHASGGTVAWTVYLGVAPTAIGFVTWAYALRRTSAGKMGATTYLVPPLAIFQGWIFLGESPPALAYAGGLLCLIGVALTRGLRLTTLSEAWVAFRSRTGRAAAATKTS